MADAPAPSLSLETREALTIIASENVWDAEDIGIVHLHLSSLLAEVTARDQTIADLREALREEHARGALTTSGRHRCQHGFYTGCCVHDGTGCGVCALLASRTPGTGT